MNEPDDLDPAHLVGHRPVPGPHPTALVPAPFAEKAMASLMQLHGELMEEKERRVDLYRRLMEREQALAELRMYVKVLEERLEAADAPQAVPAEPRAPSAPRRAEAAGRPPRPPPPPPGAQTRRQAVAAKTAAPAPSSHSARTAGKPGPARRPDDGWKTW